MCVFRSWFLKLEYLGLVSESVLKTAMVTAMLRARALEIVPPSRESFHFETGSMARSLAPLGSRSSLSRPPVFRGTYRVCKRRGSQRDDPDSARRARARFFGVFLLQHDEKTITVGPKKVTRLPLRASREKVLAFEIRARHTGRSSEYYASRTNSLRNLQKAAPLRRQRIRVLLEAALREQLGPGNQITPLATKLLTPQFSPCFRYSNENFDTRLRFAAVLVWRKPMHSSQLASFLARRGTYQNACTKHPSQRSSHLHPSMPGPHDGITRHHRHRSLRLRHVRRSERQRMRRG